MNPSTKFYTRAAVAALTIFASQPALADDDDDFGEFEGQEFLFQLEEAYTQEAGEWQVGAGFDKSFDPSESLFEFEVEYGITDRLQVAVEFPLLSEGGETGVGDIEFAVDYALLKETGEGMPELTIGFGAAAPTGDEVNGFGVGGWGYEVSLRASKQIHENVFAHATGAFEWVPNGGADADALTEWVIGAGAAWQASEPLTFVAEYLREMERETDAGMVDHETESYLSGGLSYEIADDLLVGAAGAVGLNDDSADARLIVKFQTEW